MSRDDRHPLTSAVGAVIANASNYPGKAGIHILGQDVSGLRDAVVDAALSSAWLDRVKREAAADALDEARVALIADQLERYGVVLPDINEAIDFLAESVAAIRSKATS